MQTWNYQQIVDRSFLHTLIPETENLFGLVKLELADGSIVVSKRQAFMNLFWFPILTEFDIPIRKDHFIRRRALNQDVLVGEWNRYYEEILNMNPANAKKLKKVIWDVLQDLYFFTSDALLPYVASIDIMDMAEIMEDPPMKEILDTKWKITPTMGTDVIEKYIDGYSKKIMKLFGTPGALKNEALFPYQSIRQLNKFQVPQTIYAFGVRTDVSDNIVGLPVVGSALDGWQNVQEFATELLSAKKSTFYNKVAVADSQYFGRRQHLMGSSIEHIYSHDCNSQVLVNFNVTENNYQNLVGKLIYTDKGPLTLTDANIGSFVGTQISMRSPMTCRYRKGVCSTCGGRIYNNINRKLNIGILSAVHVIEPTTQKILSAKHLVKTLSLIYELPAGASKVLFRSNTNEIRWRPTFADRVKRLYMGVPLKCFASVHDVTLIRADKGVKEERFSEIRHFVLRDSQGKEATYILENDKRVPFFSAEMLFHIRDHYNNLEMDETMMWIPLDGTEKFPIFKTIVVNDNMLQFVKNVEGFLSDDIREHTSCHTALQEFSDIIHGKVSANIVHLETLLKAYEITSPMDYRIPLVEDANNVMFQTMTSILSNRHVGTKLAYEGLKQYMGLPSTYLVPHQSSPFDLFTIGM